MEGQGVQRSGWYKQVVNLARAVVSEGLREGDRLEIMNFQQQHNNRGEIRWDGSGSAPDLVTMSNATRNALLFVHKIEREQPGRIRSSKEVVNELREEGIKYETDSVQKCLSELAEDGLLNKAQVDTNDDRREPTPGALPHEFSTTEQGREAIARFTLWFIEIAGISAPDIWELDDALDAYAHEGAFRSEEGTGRHDLLRQIIRNFEGGGR